MAERFERFASPLAVGVVVTATSFNLDLLNLGGPFIEKAGTFWWLPMLVATAVAVVCAMVVGRLVARQPGMDVLDWSRSLLGKAGGSAVCLAIAFGMLVLSIQGFSLLVRLTQLTLLPRTPVEIVLFVALAVAGQLARQDITVIVRFTIVVFAAVWVLLLGSAGLIAMGANTEYLLPVVGPGMLHSLTGLGYTAQSLLGIAALYVLAPYMTRPRRAAVAGVAGTLVSALATSLTVIAALGTLGAAGATFLRYPAVTAYETVQLTAAGVERLDMALLMGSMLQGFLLAVRPLFLSSFLIARAVGLREHASLVWFMLPGIFLGVMAPSNGRIDLHGQLAESWLGWAAIVGLPTLLAAVLLVRLRLSPRSGGAGS